MVSGKFLAEACKIFPFKAMQTMSFVHILALPWSKVGTEILMLSQKWIFFDGSSLKNQREVSLVLSSHANFSSFFCLFLRKCFSKEMFCYVKATWDWGQPLCALAEHFQRGALFPCGHPPPSAATLHSRIKPPLLWQELLTPPRDKFIFHLICTFKN